MKYIVFCEFIDGTKIGILKSFATHQEPCTINCGNTIITVYEQEYPTEEICDKVFSKYVREYKIGKYNKTFDKYKIDITKLIKKVKKTF